MISPTKFAESVSGEIAKKWIERLFSQAFLYWFFLSLVYLTQVSPETRELLFARLGASLNNDETLTRVIVAWTAAAAIGGLFLVGGTAALAERLQFQVLRWLEGYWPKLLDPVAAWGHRRARRRIDCIDRRWKELAVKYSQRTTRERLEYGRLDRIRARYPLDRTQVLPTDLGNVLKEAETYARERYGLAGVLMWPRLWLILPKEDREEIGRAQERLNDGVRAVIFSGALAPWAVWVWWLLPLAGIAGFLSYKHTVGQAASFADLVKAAFDTHYRSLLERMGWQPEKLDGTGDHTAPGKAASFFVMRGKLLNPATGAGEAEKNSDPIKKVAQIALTGYLLFAGIKRLLETTVSPTSRGTERNS